MPIPGPPRQPSFASIPNPNVDSGAATMLERPASTAAFTADEPKRNAWFVPLAVIFTLLASLGGVFAFLKYRDAQATPPPTAESAQAPQPTVAPNATSAPPAAAAPQATAPAPEPVATPSATPSARPEVAPPRGVQGRALPSSKPSAAPSAAPKATGAPAVAPPSNAGDLTVTTCTEIMPDGTKKVVPCK
jgi:outer membrane biosynthesis protein TonB